MQIDHLAYRCENRFALSDFFIRELGYKIQATFQIVFDDGTVADSIALEKPGSPELFVSDGKPDSVVWHWVQLHGSGIHHVAYAVADVKETMERWKREGIAKFTTEEPIFCEEEQLVQVFTHVVPMLGHVVELIQREKHGFCLSSVKKLMEASKG